MLIEERSVTVSTIQLKSFTTAHKIFITMIMIDNKYGLIIAV